MPNDFPAAFAALRAILSRHSDGMIVQTDKPADFTLLARGIGPNKKPMWFGAVLLKKSAVTFHLMPLYYNPKLQGSVSAELSKRKQGKTCFNFRKADEALFAQLDELTRLGRECWERAGFLEAGPIPAERFEASLRARGEDPAAIAKVRKKKAGQAAAKRAATIRKKAVGRQKGK
jgi:hypothetical protein